MSTTVVAGRYRLERELGRGGMASVHLARDSELGRDVAVKLLGVSVADDPVLRERFLREAQLAARLNHPNVVAVFDVGDDDGRPYIVMELVPGESLDRMIVRETRLPPGRVVDLGRQASAGLAHAHAAGLVHRDVKPHNLLVRDDGVVKVADFGIARAAGLERLTQTGTILGTAAYIAPELAHGGSATPATDVWGLGASLYQALTGRTPFTARTLPELADQQRVGRITPVRALAPDVPVAVEEATMRCLAADPAARPSAAELGRLLESRAPASEAPTLPLTGETQPLRRPRGWGVRRLAVAAAAVAAAAGIGVAIVDRDDDASRPAPPARGETPAQEARNLASWLRANAG